MLKGFILGDVDKCLRACSDIYQMDEALASAGMHYAETKALFLKLVYQIEPEETADEYEQYKTSLEKLYNIMHAKYDDPQEVANRYAKEDQVAVTFYNESGAADGFILMDKDEYEREKEKNKWLSSYMT